MAIPPNRQSYFPVIQPQPSPTETYLHLKNLYTAINDHDKAIDLLNGMTTTNTTVIKTISASAPSPSPPPPPPIIMYSDDETPSGTVNGVNTTFTLANIPNPPASLQLFNNGLLQQSGGVDYTLSGATITYVVAPPTGTDLQAWYRF